MNQGLIIALVAGLSVMLGWGFADFFAKKTIDALGSLPSLVWAHIFGTLSFALFAAYQFFILKNPLVLPSDIGVWGLLILFGLLQGLVYLLSYEGFGKGQLAILNPVFSSYSGIVAIFSILVFGEKTSLLMLISLAIIFIGVILLSIDHQSIKAHRLSLIKTPGLKEILLAAVLAAIWTLGWNRLLAGNDGLTYALFMYIFMTLGLFIFSKIKKIKLAITKPHFYKFLLLIGGCEAVAYLALSLGFSYTSFTSVIVLLGGAFSLPVLILSHVFLKEKVNITQRIGTLVVILGVIMLLIY